MANHNANGKSVKGGHELAQRTRGAILNAFGAVETQGKVVSEVLAEAFLANPIRFMDMAAKYIPKDINMEVTKVAAHALSDEELEQIIGERARQKHIDNQTLDAEYEEIEDKAGAKL